MGLVAVSAGVTSGESVISTQATVGPATGGIFVAVALIFLFAYLNVLEASEADHPALRRQLISLTVPLTIAFASIVMFSAVQFL